MSAPSTFRVLLIDDDAALARMLSEYLSNYGLEVESAGDAEGGLAKLRCDPKPDVVVLDVMLPGRNGLELCRDIRTKSQVPIIMVTAVGETTDRIVGL
ncbi:MAG TPA: response regulator, partial [Vicinamibacteria bacterium]|nr:response regulator [Vicinamibacteria bacterium]